MKKLLIFVLAVIVLGSIAAGGVAYQYPHVIAIAEEGFPATKWPAKGIYVQVTGKPIAWPPKLKPMPPKQGDAARELQQLNTDNQTEALVAYHKGQLKYAYFKEGFDPLTQFNSFSMAKSLIGYLVLKAIDEGEIDSLQSQIGDYLLGFKDKNLREQTIEHFLTMTSGLKIEKKGPPKPLAKDAKRGPDKDASNPFTLLAQLHIEGLAGIRDHLSIADNADLSYHYQNVNTALLGLMLTRIYKKPLNVILSEKIWRPAGAANARWRTYTNEGSVTPYCCLFATVEDWAKVAIYLSKNGTVDEPFLSPSMEKLISAKRYAPSLLREGVYGLHVRHDILDRDGESIKGPFTYFVGHGGQLVYLIPDYDLVIVRFGRKHTLLHSTAYYLWRIINGETGS